MSLKRYRLLEIIIIVILAALVGVAVGKGYAWVPAPVIIAAIVIGVLMRQKVKEFAVDERVDSIAEKSLTLASGIFIIVATPIGITFIALGQKTLPLLEPIGWTLALASCALVLIYYIANLYYNNKYSGKK